MAKRKIHWNGKKYERFMKEGRGQGEGKDYKPWLMIQDFPSQGRVSRILGWKSKRIHHLFSDMQTRFFYFLEWQDNVIDIREQFPLLDLEDTVEFNEDLLLDSYKDKHSEEPFVLTSTFLVTLRGNDNRNILIARSLKHSRELEKNKTIKHLEVQRRYWLSKGVDWGVITQKGIDLTFSKNVEWVHPTLYSYVDRGFSLEEIQYLSNVLLERLESCSKSIRKVTADFDKDFNQSAGTGLFIFKFLVASKQIEIDMYKPIDLSKQGSDIYITQQSERGQAIYASGQ